MSKIEQIATAVIDEGFKLHREFGPELLESFYRVVLSRSLKRRGLFVQAESSISFSYEGTNFDGIFRADLIVDDCLVVELKSVERLLPVHSAQVLTYLRVLNFPLGTLINMGSPMFRDGVFRILNPRADLTTIIVKPGS